MGSPSDLRHPLHRGRPGRARPQICHSACNCPGLSSARSLGGPDRPLWLTHVRIPAAGSAALTAQGLARNARRSVSAVEQQSCAGPPTAVPGELATGAPRPRRPADGGPFGSPAAPSVHSSVRWLGVLVVPPPPMARAGCGPHRRLSVLSLRTQPQPRTAGSPDTAEGHSSLTPSVTHSRAHSGVDRPAGAPSATPLPGASWVPRTAGGPGRGPAQPRPARRETPWSPLACLEGAASEDPPLSLMISHTHGRRLPDGDTRQVSHQQGRISHWDVVSGTAACKVNAPKCNTGKPARPHLPAPSPPPPSSGSRHPSSAHPSGSFCSGLCPADCSPVCTEVGPAPPLDLILRLALERGPLPPAQPPPPPPPCKS